MVDRKTSENPSRKTARRAAKSTSKPVAKAAPAPKAAAASAEAAAETAPPAKAIILFSDGTGNSSGKLFKTNVWRLYEALDLGPPAEERPPQIAYYDNGVGTSGFKLLQLLGGIFGYGLRRNVLEIYRYACRNYNPASRPAADSDVQDEGDQIYGFGFSRGAYTMRLVIGLIADQGLVPYKNESDLEEKTKAAWKDFRRTSWPRIWRRLFVRGKPASADQAAAQGQSPETAVPRKETGNHWPVIRMIGVWDTVAAYGGPVAEITRAIDNWIWPLSMPNYALHPRIRSARHALALDDERDSFWPLLWDEVAEKEMRGAQVDGKPAPWLNDKRLKQVWFAGMHADVGGGYPDESLSYVSLLWMIGEAQHSGLRTVNEITERYLALANSFGPMHDSRGGMGSYYRYQPRRISAFLAKPAGHTMVTSTLSLRDPQIGAGRDEKGLLTSVAVHESVIARIASGTDGYAPIVLPADFEIVPSRAEVAETVALATTGGDPFQEDPGGGARTPLLDDRVRAGLEDDEKVKPAIAKAMEKPWNYVLLRRMAYFLTVGATLALLAMPWWVAGFGQQASSGLQLALDGRNLLGNLIRLPGALLPDFAQRWVETWATYSVVTIILVVAIIIFRKMGSALQARIRDRARAIWHGSVPRIPPGSADGDVEAARPHKPTLIEKARKSHGYQRAVQWMKWYILPNLVFAPLLGLLIGVAFFGVVTQSVVPVLERGESLCPHGEIREIGAGARFDFSTNALCNRSGIRVAAGERYQISFEVVKPWEDVGPRDGPGYPTTVRGLAAGDIRWTVGYLGVPFRRVPDARYLQPLAAVRGAEEGIFSGRLSSMPILPLEVTQVEGDSTRYTAAFRAAEDGELLLFANDSVALFDLRFFYRYNRGTACVTVTPARPVDGTIPEGGPVCQEAARKLVGGAGPPS